MTISGNCGFNRMPFDVESLVTTALSHMKVRLSENVVEFGRNWVFIITHSDYKCSLTRILNPLSPHSFIYTAKWPELVLVNVFGGKRIYLLGSNMSVCLSVSFIFSLLWLFPALSLQISANKPLNSYDSWSYSLNVNVNYRLLFCSLLITSGRWCV